MDIPRELAIRILDQATFHGGKDDEWWIDMMLDNGLYDEENGTWPTVSDIFGAIGVSKEEFDNAVRPK